MRYPTRLDQSGYRSGPREWSPTEQLQPSLTLVRDLVGMRAAKQNKKLLAFLAPSLCSSVINQSAGKRFYHACLTPPYCLDSGMTIVGISVKSISNPTAYNYVSTFLGRNCFLHRRYLSVHSCLIDWWNSGCYSQNTERKVKECNTASILITKPPFFVFPAKVRHVRSCERRRDFNRQFQTLTFKEGKQVCEADRESAWFSVHASPLESPWMQKPRFVFIIWEYNYYKDK